MRILKLSVFFRSLDPLRSFESANGKSFWECFEEKIKDIGISDYVIDKKGTAQCIIYFSSDKESDVLKIMVSEISDSLFEKSTDKPNLSVKELSSEELDSLRANNTASINNKSWFSGEAQKSSAASSETSPSSLFGSFLQGEPTPPAADTDVSAVFEQTKKIEKFRQQLSDVVKGQRRAVEEVTQAIFECDIFSKPDKDRTGPLCTFLFAGPSGVGKTFLAKTSAKAIGMKSKVFDMSDYSDYFGTNNFLSAMKWVKENPRSVVVFDEMEKASSAVINLFIQILEEGRITNVETGINISFKDAIIIVTTNAGRNFYEQSGLTDFSNVSKSVILDALKNDKDPNTGRCYFPDYITTRFANGHVVLFNYLEPFSLMAIVKTEIRKYVDIFETQTGIKVSYDEDELAALIIYSTGGIADARTLRGIAKSTVIRELQDMLMQTYTRYGDGVNELKEITLKICYEESDEAVRNLFVRNEDLTVIAFCDDKTAGLLSECKAEGVKFEFFSDMAAFKKRSRGIADFILVDPFCGMHDMKYMPNDIEDIKSDGVELISYFTEYSGSIPLYIIDRKNNESAYNTLLSKGVRGIVRTNENMKEDFDVIVRSSVISNCVYSLTRSNKDLVYNCAQYNEDETRGTIFFERLRLRSSLHAGDAGDAFNPDEKTEVKFDDIIGCKPAKEELKRFCEFVENPRAFVSKGRNVPKGILLYGPPGTGKTMLAKAMANEAKARFFPVVASSFFNKYVGETEENIRQKFAQARRYAPSIIFIDEVDAIARERNGDSSTKINEDALTTLISQMDGFATDETRPVFIMAATNYDVSSESSKSLDPAFVRRFDKKIYIGLPEEDDRFEFLSRELRKHSIDFGEKHEEILRNLAERSVGLSTADLAAVVNMFLNDSFDKEIKANDLMEALDTFRFGEVSTIDRKSLRQTACHEAGHALVYALSGEMPSFLTVVSRGSYGGYMEHASDNKKTTFTCEDIMSRVRTSLAGRLAEIEIYGEASGINSGASSDIEHARSWIKTAVEKYAMGEKLMSSNEEEQENMLRAQYEKTAELIASHRDTLLELTDLLVSEMKLNAAQLKDFFTAHSIGAE